MFTWIRYNIKGDRWIWLIAIVLSIIGLLSVYSATSLLAFQNKGGNTDSLVTKVPNNKYQNCPALMADGRHFTDYRPSCFTNGDLITQGNIKSSYDYRRYLINNAEKIMMTK